MDTTDGGLRERKKQRTRRDLTAAAARLFDARGFDDVTIEEIAEAAEVSPRTFYRYFTSKEELIFGDLDESLDAIRQALDERPTDEAPMVSLRALFLRRAQAIDADPAAMRWQGAVIRANPSLHTRRHEHQRALEAAVVPIIAERTGASPSDLGPLLVVSVAFAAFRAAIITWITSESTGRLTDLVDTATAPLLAGFGDAD